MARELLVPDYEVENGVRLLTPLDVQLMGGKNQVVITTGDKSRPLDQGPLLMLTQD